MSNGNKHLYSGDNLDTLRKYIPDNSIDLIYLDPPFNSKKGYNILFKENDAQWSPAQIKAFEDTWRWDTKAEATYQELITKSPMKLAKLISAMRDGIGANDVTAYLVMMAVRLAELHRVLKPTGSLYLHCDPTMSHYIKLILDQVFGPKNFRMKLSGVFPSEGKAKKDLHANIIPFFTIQRAKTYTFNGTAVTIPRKAGTHSFGGKIGIHEQGKENLSLLSRRRQNT